MSEVLIHDRVSRKGRISTSRSVKKNASSLAILMKFNQASLNEFIATTNAQFDAQSEPSFAIFCLR
jgi:hypothetical protein